MKEKSHTWYVQKRKSKRRRTSEHDNKSEFWCRNCHRIVPAGVGYSGVWNRNHCPYCLHSRHVDLTEAGDRLSACKSVMEPVGLACKRVMNKYGSQYGELMLIHLCLDCGKVSINRIARDDDAELIFEYFQNSFEMQPELRDRLKAQEIFILGKAETEFVIERLFGLGLAPIPMY